MLRVGFVFRGGDSWLGGVNYLWNLLYAIGAHAPSLEPVLISAPDSALHGLDALPNVEVARVLPPEGSIVARTAQRRLLGRDEAMATLASSLRLDVLSHSGTFGWRFPIPMLPWIPDLQHHRLPQNFSVQERALRTYVDVSQLIEGASTIVSSAAAQADCRRYYGSLARRTEVLRFVSQPRIDLSALSTHEELRARYDLPERWLFLPNQFWRHKNHAVVIEAASILAARGVRPTIVMTGKGEDYRAPEHYRTLMQRVADAGLTSTLRHLGLVPFADLSALMRDSVAVVNPSLFEGWSTTVEEARSLGKRTILSDIDVHREQDPPDAQFFAPHDAHALAQHLEAAFDSFDSHEDARRAEVARLALPERTRAFAARYAEIATQGRVTARTA